MKKTIVIAAATALAATAVTATATTLITSSQIKNGTIKAIDIQKGAITSDRLTPALRTKLNKVGIQSAGGNGATGAPGLNGTAGAAGANGANGANGNDGASAISTKIVTAANKQGYFYGSIDKTEVENTGNAAASIQGGAGAKFLHLDVNGDNSFATFRTAYATPIPLASVSFAGFDYKIDADSAQIDAPQYKFVLLGTKSTATGGFTTLIFEPTTAYPNPTLGTWHTVNTAYGKWRSTRQIPGTTAVGGFFYGSLEDIVTNNPDSVIVKHQVEQGQSGAGSAGFKGAIDNVRLGINGETTTFDFG